MLSHSKKNKLFNKLALYLNLAKDIKCPLVIITASKKKFASLYQFSCLNEDIEPKMITEICSNTCAFYDQNTHTIVIKKSYYKDYRPETTLYHEMIHHIQYQYGNSAGKYSIFSEGLTEVITHLLTGNFEDTAYKTEFILSLELLKRAYSNNFILIVNSIKKYHVHTNKNKFILELLKKSKIFKRPNKIEECLTKTCDELKSSGAYQRAAFKECLKILNQYLKEPIKNLSFKKYKTYINYLRKLQN